MVTDFFERKALSVKVRVGRRVFRNSTNSPYLSGDGFAALCDISYHSPGEKFKLPTAEVIGKANSIFCVSHKIEEMLSAYGDAINAKVIVTGNSDRDFYSLDLELPQSITRVYLQNSHMSGEKYRTLPIGVENIRYGKNGYKKFFDSNLASIKKKDAILVGPFSPTHPEREELDAWHQIRDERIFAIRKYLKTKEIACTSAGFLYVACPRGNGTDTHRFWETIYRGSIPVVKESNWSKSIAELGVPILQLEQWDFEEFIWKKTENEFLPTNPSEISSLWLAHWEKEFTS